MLLVKTCFLLSHSPRIQVGSLPKCKIPFCAIWKVSSTATLSLRASHRSSKGGQVSHLGQRGGDAELLTPAGHQLARLWDGSPRAPKPPPQPGAASREPCGNLPSHQLQRDWAASPETPARCPFLGTETSPLLLVLCPGRLRYDTRVTARMCALVLSGQPESSYCFSFDPQDRVPMYLLQDYIVCAISSSSGNAPKVAFELLTL